MSLSPPTQLCPICFSGLSALPCPLAIGILLLPITGFSGITQTKPQIIVMTTMDQIQMLVPSEAVTAGDPHLSQLLSGGSQG